jgi:hypothetical protein
MMLTGAESNLIGRILVSSALTPKLRIPETKILFPAMGRIVFFQ